MQMERTGKHYVQNLYIRVFDKKKQFFNKYFLLNKWSAKILEIEVNGFFKVFFEVFKVLKKPCKSI